MRLIAHRGFADLYPENTLRAVESAVARADAVEVDVRRCASSELVVIHDETVDRVADATGRVADLPLEDLRRVDVLGTGDGVPTLASVFDAIPPTVGVNVELKEPDLAADAVDVAAGHDNHIILSAFWPEALEAARGIEATPSLALLVGEDAPAREVVERASELGCDYLHPHRSLCDERLVAESHHAGMSVNAWTVDSRSQARTLDRVGVDGVIADRWGVLPPSG